MILTPIEIILLSALAICFAVQLYYVLFVHVKLLKHPLEKLPTRSKLPISVIICARNEIENLKIFLPSVLNQDYFDFEVIVVNDRSFDGSEDYLKELAKTNDKLKIVKILDSNKFVASKKFAVTMGIKAAKNEWLVFTDADCDPVSKKWLRYMQQPTDGDKDIVLGYSPYMKNPGVLNALIRFETFFTAVNYLAFALKGMPYMGVGRNLAYKKSIFFKSKGFAAHMHIPSGDDDLFVNANANAQNTNICLHNESHVLSVPNTTWSNYLKQKKRHFGAGKLYKKEHKFILTLQIAAQFLFYTLFFVLLFFNREAQWIALGILLLSLVIKCLVYPKLLKRLSYSDLRWWFPILDILLFFFLTANACISLFGKKGVRWK